MGIKKTYVNYPLETGNNVQGLKKTESLDKLLDLFQIKKLDNKILNIPSQNSSNYPQNLPTNELKNLFRDNSGNQIAFISDLHSQFKVENIT